MEPIVPSNEPCNKLKEISSTLSQNKNKAGMTNQNRIYEENLDNSNI